MATKCDLEPTAIYEIEEKEFSLGFDENIENDYESESYNPNLRYGQNARSKSLLKYNEMERERNKRRQHIMKQPTTSKCTSGNLKLAMMNAGLIPLKKGKMYFLFLNTGDS